MMRNIFVLMVSLALSLSSTGHAYNHFPGVFADKITVYIFMHEACIISQYYSLPLREMHEEYANDNLQFVGLFSNPSSEAYKVHMFKDKYNIPFELRTDHYHLKTEELGATVTPEVVVYNESQGEILCKGRIDDAYARVGRRKQVTTTSELKDVLEALKNNQPIPTTHTKAVGCFIGKTKLINHKDQ